ncbi:PREDICTED: uncharacterized protein LOC100637530 isoform X2 [Amphimedon queenslandica]|uniref:Uncharacterized protein n=1 Tax=Amphimedon queenslandica TaxID=400682 RepID=A0A1X7VSZ4_AMPQE|nr:PREDICTED: uncharacterized protein LOC100637530 isoform X2 [Amphimedon queenslandica]|eukprot:XP_003382797.1 PREDICTED: uncharacterized protein LOC100637530 isoform X2 [Amphimedon queenslandica]
MAAQQETGFSTQYESGVPQGGGGHRQIGRNYQKTVIVDHEPEYTKHSASPVIPLTPGDRHLTISLIMLIVSVMCCNPISLFCAVFAVVFSVKARSAELEGKKEVMQANDKTSFGFAIFSIIGLMTSVCVVGFVVHRELCGASATSCDTRTHV